LARTPGKEVIAGAIIVIAHAIRAESIPVTTASRPKH
jgi:hypothetical protein